MGIIMKPDESAWNSLKTNSRLYSLGFLSSQAIYNAKNNLHCCAQSMDFNVDGGGIIYENALSSTLEFPYKVGYSTRR